MPQFVHGQGTFDHFNKVVEDIRGTADDRTCGILAGVFLDNLLFDLLYHCLPESPVVDREALFAFNGPLGSFANKIKLVHLMGLITIGDVASLNVIKDIRNLCAHSLGVREDQVIDFMHPSMLERLKKVYSPKLLEKIPNEKRKRLTLVRDVSLEKIGGRAFFEVLFDLVALSIFARFQIVSPFQLPDEITEHRAANHAQPTAETDGPTDAQ
jgi:hypothetical protein